MKKFLFLSVLFFLSFWLFAEADSYPKTITLSDGQQITLQQKPQRIFVGYVSVLEILEGVVPAEKIVAAPKFCSNEEYSNCISFAQKIKVLYEGLEIEMIEKLNPDLLILASFNDKKFLERLKEFKRPYVVLKQFSSYDDICAQMKDIGLLVGEEHKISLKITQMDDKIKNCQKELAHQKIRMMSFSSEGYTAGAKTTFNDLVLMANGINASAEKGLEGFQTVSYEELVAMKPEWIIIFGAGEEAKENFLKEFERVPVAPLIPAIKKKQIVILKHSQVNALSEHYVKALESLLKQIKSDLK